MANSLGEIAVNLTLNTAQFLSGFGSAGVASKKFRSELSDSIEGIGGALEGVLGKFGEFGAVIAETIGSATSAASSAVVSFGKLGGTIGTIAGIGAGAAAAILSIDAGAIGLAIHTAESAAQLGEMSQKAGISAQALAGLSLAGKKVGVDTETITKALGFLNANMVKAAIAPEGAKTAFSRMGIDVKDAEGKIRDTGSVLLDVIGKVSNLPQPEQGFIVKQLLGKGGVALIPLINQGLEEINKNTAEATKFGLGDPDTIAGAQKFKETVVDIQAEFEGMALRLTKDLLPALQFLSERLVSAFDTGTAQDLIDKIAELVKATLVFGYDLYQLTQLDVFGKISSNISGLEGAMRASGLKVRQFLLQFNPGDSDFVKAQQEKTAKALEDNARETAQNVNKSLGGISWEQFLSNSEKFKAGLSGTAPFPAKFGDFDFTKTPLPRKPPTGDFDLSKTKEDTTLARVKERIAALIREAAEWRNVAGAGTQSEALIAEAVKKGNDEFGKLKTEAARDKTGRAQVLVGKDEGVIKAAGEEAVFGAAIKTLLTDLDKQKEKLGEQANAAVALGAAYKQGGAAIASAALDKQFADQESKINVLQQVHDKLAKTLGSGSAVVLQFAAAIATANATLNTSKQEATLKMSADLTDSLLAQSGAYAALRPGVDAVSAAYLQGEQALRAARIELELQKFAYDELDKGLVVTQAQIQQKRRILEDADRQSHTDAIQQAAAQFDLNLQYSEEIRRLEQVREALQAVGASTLLVDAAEFDAQNKMLQQWDAAVFKVGTFGQKVQGVFNELVVQGRDAGANIAHAFLTAIDSAETNLAKLLTGQKANFKQVFQNLAESVVKAGIQQTVGKIAGGLGINLGKLGIGGKRDGSSAAQALFVTMAAAGLGGALSGGESTGGVAGGIIGKIAGKLGLGGVIGAAGGGVAPDGTAANPFYVLDASQGGLAGGGLFGGGSGGGGGLLGTLGSIFGGGGGESSLPFAAGELGAPSAVPGVVGAISSNFGSILSSAFSFLPFLAGGGDVTPGRSYIVGERHAELFTPKEAGTISPSTKSSDHRQTNITNVFNGFKDTDMFRRSTSQLTQMFHTQLSIAQARG